MHFFCIGAALIDLRPLAEVHSHSREQAQPHIKSLKGKYSFFPSVSIVGMEGIIKNMSFKFGPYIYLF